MTPVLLMRSLKTSLEGVVENVELTSPKGVLTKPQVFLEQLPQKSASSQEEDFPFIIVRAAGGEDADGNKSTMKINLIIGTYSKDDDGFIDVLNLFEGIRQALLKKRIVGKSFRMELPFVWRLFDEQPWPGWIGEINTLWTIPQVQEEVNFE